MKTTLSQRLERIYKEQKWTDGATLAEICGVSRGAVSIWRKSDGAGISTEKALRIERQLGYRHEWVKNGEEPVYVDEVRQSIPKADPLDIADRQMDDILELLMLFKNADDVGRNSILSAARTARRRDVTRRGIVDNQV